MLSLRTATDADAGVIAALIERSARELSRAYYSPEQVEAALAGAFGLDSQLLEDGTYYLVLKAGQPLGCGGWSYRRTLFGADRQAGRDPTPLDPHTEAAKIRALFVEPASARRGVGRHLLAHCEAQARARGFQRFELMATLPGVPFYAACGYQRGEALCLALGGGLTIDFVAMHKTAEGEARESS